MTAIAPYLAFNGNCREAITYYGQVFGAEPIIQTFGESPVDAADGDKNRVMHASLTAGAVQLMASDSMPDQPVAAGSNVSLSVHTESEDEQTRLFNALAEGGNVTMPLQDVLGRPDGVPILTSTGCSARNRQLIGRSRRRRGIG
jgi:PhnB protein